jgi:TetR/AcrR family transcriptional regulator
LSTDRPSRRDPQATRQAILEAAEEVFLERGFGNASMSSIAQRAAVTKSLIHHHFGSKDGLWTEVKSRRLSAYFEEQLQMLEASEPGVDLLQRSIEHYFRFLQRNPEVVRLAAWMYLEHDDDCSNLDQELQETGVERIREAQERGEIRGDLHPRSVLVSFIALTQFWFQSREHLWLEQAPTASPEAIDETYFQDMLRIYFEGVLPAGSSASPRRRSSADSEDS